MHLMTNSEGHFLRAEARAGLGGDVQVWARFDHCSLVLTPEEAWKLAASLRKAAADAEHLGLSLILGNALKSALETPIAFGLDLAEGPDRAGLAPAHHTTNPEG